MMQYQVSRNCERVPRIDGHCVARGPLADFADKAEPGKFMARAVPYRGERKKEREREREREFQFQFEKICYPYCHRVSAVPEISLNSANSA